MRCPNCGKNLGAGPAPARCPECGHELTQDAVVGGPDAPADDASSISAVAGVGKARRFTPALILIAVLLIALAALLVWFVGFRSQLWGGIKLPDVVGMQVQEATDDLEALGFEVREIERRSDEEPGTVLEQEPEAGRRLPEGARVSLVISGARTMPDVVGKDIAEARELLEAEGIKYTESQVPSDQQHGLVLSSSIEAGARVLSGDVAELSVAAPFTVPAVLGLTQDEATQAIEAGYLTPNVITTPAQDGQTPGTVVAVDPAEGTEVAAWSQVTIAIAVDQASRMENWASRVINIVYGSDPLANNTYRLGSELRYWLRPEYEVAIADGSGTHPVAEATDLEVWYGVIKHWGAFPDQGDALQQLSRSLISEKYTADPAAGTVTCEIDVEWNWDRLQAEYVGTTSHDVRTVTLWFDENGYLLWFDDPLSDVPKHDVEYVE